MNEIKPQNIHQVPLIVSVQGTVTDPKEFSEGGSEHRKAIIANAALIAVLISSTELKPVLLGVTVSVPVLWVLIGISHMYFFCMWRLTATIEADVEKKFWNLKVFTGKQQHGDTQKTFLAKPKLS
jgi:hypothetical protein